MAQSAASTRNLILYSPIEKKERKEDDHTSFNYNAPCHQLLGNIRESARPLSPVEEMVWSVCEDCSCSNVQPETLRIGSLLPGTGWTDVELLGLN